MAFDPTKENFRSNTQILTCKVYFEMLLYLIKEYLQDINNI